MPTWNYDVITMKAETVIKRIMNGAEKLNDVDARYREGEAFGAFLLWEALTDGEGEEGDAERLEALTHRNGRYQA